MMQPLVSIIVSLVGDGETEERMHGCMALPATTRSGLFGQLLSANCILQLDNRILICGSLARKSTKQTKITWRDEKFDSLIMFHSSSLR